MAANFNTIYVHPGLPKCGSSYLQNAFSILEQKEFFGNTTYPIFKKTDSFALLHAGNMAHLHKRIRRNESDAKIQKTWDSILSHASQGKENVLLSREGLLELPPADIKKLEDRLLRNCNRVVMLVVVRPFSEHLYSTYYPRTLANKQMTSFEEWLTPEACDFETNVLMFGTQEFKALMETNIEYEIIPYAKTGLLESFLPYLGESPDIAKHLPQATVNRSLTENERYLMASLQKESQDEKLLRFVRNAININRTQPLGSQMDPRLEQRIHDQLPRIFEALQGMKDFEKFKTIFSKKHSTANYASFLSSQTEDFADIARVMFKAIEEYKCNRAWHKKLKKWCQI